MGFKKGNNIGAGRPRGSINKVNQDVKDMLQAIYDGNLSNIQADLDLMSPKDKWATLNKMSDKFLPSLKSVDLEVAPKGNGSLGFSIGYADDTTDASGEVEENDSNSGEDNKI